MKIDSFTIDRELITIKFILYTLLYPGMPRYVPTVRERVTSGHAMLALSNADMEKRLSMSHPLHRRRLRLVIEEQRGPKKG